MKKNILVVIGALTLGGAENVAMNICRYMPNDKYKISYLIYGNEQGDYELEAIKNGAAIIRIKYEKNILKYIKTIDYILSKKHFDVIHVHTLFNSGLWLRQAKKNNIPIRICHSHTTSSGKNETLIYKGYKFYMRYLILKYATKFAACGSAAGNFLYGSKNFQKTGEIIENGIDIDDYLYNKKYREEYGKELHLENNFIIGHIGRLDKVKNHVFLIKVFKEILKREKNSKLIIVGDGPEKNKIKNLIRQNQLEKSVLMLGMRNDVNRLLSFMNVLIFPSFYEGFPIALIEAQAASLPSIVSETITREVDIISQMEFLSLEDSASLWAKEAVKYKGFHREGLIMDAIYKYDIKNVMKKLEALYENC